MHSSRQFQLRAAALVAAILLGGAAFAQHPAVDLYDKDFNVINPVTGENADKPFSTENTCGTCHDYAEITSGYHFQMGWKEIADDFGRQQGRPWELSNGLMGRWYPYSPRQLAKKKNISPDEIDLTVYDFIGFSGSRDQLPCGACHPGGGGLQTDRDGNRYDTTLAGNPALRDALDGDYYRSNWDKSGVVEADCFICHHHGYSFDERVTQLTRGNYQWAMIAAMGIGIVEGAVSRGEEPKVTYNKYLFNPNGSYTPRVTGPPPAANCNYCHSKENMGKRGFSWDDVQNPDIHNQQGIGCVACHNAGLDHQIAKGDSRLTKLAPGLDNTMQDCAECHESGFMGATVPHHETVRPSHLKRVACESCHIPDVNRAAVQTVDLTTGSVHRITKPAGAEAVGDAATWGPAYERLEDGIIYPFNSVLAVWWGNLEDDGTVHPLFLREQAAAWKLCSEAVTDDDEDGHPEVNRDEEIVAGLKALQQTLQGNARFRQVRPVFVKTDKVWHLDDSGAAATMEYDLRDLGRIDFALSHNVSPAQLSLGARSCGDCHSTKAHFFTGQRVVDPYGPTGTAVTQSNGWSFGCKPWAFWINSFHQQILSPLVSIGIILVIFLITLHYHSYGPKRIPFEPFSHQVKRFSFLERGIHLFRLISFVLLTVTGLIMAFNLTAWQELLFRDPDQVLTLHILFGVVFIVTTVLGIAVWFRDALFADYDKVWVQRIGGYLGYEGHVPSGRFNAGQKMFYWYTTILASVMSVTGLVLIFKDFFGLAEICLTSTLHNLIGFGLIAGVLAHAYLGTIANPGTWRVLVDGYVTRKWAEHHHPYWYHSLIEEGEIPAEEPADSDAAATKPAQQPASASEAADDAEDNRG